MAFAGALSNNQQAFLSTVARKRSDGGGEVEDLVRSARNMSPDDWSPDGRFVLYTEGMPGNNQTVWAVPLAGDRKPIPVTTLKEGVDQAHAAFSPDSRWVAYSSTESGRSEAYVVPFNHGGGRWQVSSTGGDHPRWSSNGKELFYMALDRTLMAVPVAVSKESIKLGTAQPLFRTSVIAAAFSLYDVSADGKRFVIASTIQSQNAPVALAVNWAEALKK